MDHATFKKCPGVLYVNIHHVDISPGSPLHTKLMQRKGRTCSCDVVFEHQRFSFPLERDPHACEEECRFIPKTTKDSTDPPRGQMLIDVPEYFGPSQFSVELFKRSRKLRARSKLVATTQGRLYDGVHSSWKNALASLVDAKLSLDSEARAPVAHDNDSSTDSPSHPSQDQEDAYVRQLRLDVQRHNYQLSNGLGTVAADVYFVPLPKHHKIAVHDAHRAAASGATRMMRALLKRAEIYHTLNKRTIDHVKLSPFDMAARNGHVETFQCMLGVCSHRRVGKVLKSTSARNQTLLHYAVLGGNPEIVSTVVDLYSSQILQSSYNYSMFGIRPSPTQEEETPFFDRANVDGHTAIALACRDLDDDVAHEIARLLVGFGASVSATDAKGNTPLLLACKSRKTATAAYLLSLRGSTPSNSSMVRSRPNMQNHEREFPLHVAAAHGDADLVRELLANGASIMSRDKDGCTALHVGARGGFQDVVQVLVDHVHQSHAPKTPVVDEDAGSDENCESVGGANVNRGIGQDGRGGSRDDRKVPTSIFLFRDAIKLCTAGEIARQLGENSMAELLEREEALERARRDGGKGENGGGGDEDWYVYDEA